MVGDLQIQRIPLFDQVEDPLTRIVRLEQGPVLVAAQSLPEIGRRRPQVDDQPARRQRLAVFRKQYGPAAGGKDQVAAAGQFVDQLRFAATETVLAFEVENGGNVDAETALRARGRRR